jgi:CYTH domain-containing protein
MMRLTRRFIVKSLNHLSLSDSIRYERYYINDELRVQKKGDTYEKEVLNEENIVVKKIPITKEEFDELKKSAYSKLIRDSYQYLEDDRVSIKQYYGDFEGLNRVEVKFISKQEMASYEKEDWMGEEITDSPLAFDKDLSKQNREEFLVEIQKFIE